MKVFRFPYGDRGGAMLGQIQNILKNLGYKQPKFEGINYRAYHRLGFVKGADCYWTADIKEWKYKGLDSIKKHLKGANGRTDDIGRLHDPSSSDIVLIHDHTDTTEVFFEVIDYLVENNITFLLPAAD